MLITAGNTNSGRIAKADNQKEKGVGLWQAKM